MNFTLNQKDQRIIKCHEKGMTPAQIAKKIGYGGNAVTAGIERVKQTLLKIKK